MKGWIHGDIEPLMSEWGRLKGAWRACPRRADWQGLRSLAERAAVTRERETGLAMPCQALRRGEPDVFDEKFLEYLIEAGFDPFEALSDRPLALPLDHAALIAATERGNESARRMRALCDRAARVKFDALLGGPGARRISEAELGGLRRAWEAFNAILPQDLRSRGRCDWPALRSDRRQQRPGRARLGALRRASRGGPAPSER